MHNVKKQEKRCSGGAAASQSHHLSYLLWSDQSSRSRQQQQQQRVPHRQRLYFQSISALAIQDRPVYANQLWKRRTRKSASGRKSTKDKDSDDDDEANYMSIYLRNIKR